MLLPFPEQFRTTKAGPVQDTGSPCAEPAARLGQSLSAWPGCRWLCSTARRGLPGIFFLIRAVLQQNRFLLTTEILAQPGEAIGWR